MKREDVKAKIPGITDEQLNWLMSENGADINREKTVAEQFKTQFENTQAQLKIAQDGLAKFNGKKTPGRGLREELFVPVVGAALDDLDHAAINAVDDPVCIVDAAAPIAGQIAAEALGLADALIAVAVDVLQKL